ncbi:MAG: DUF4416 family protein [Deltaproteobacteria bacterium]|nr:DUF4416 family protein [Deltaproteobacteria bacterium]
MSTPRPFDPVKLIVSIFGLDRRRLNETIKFLSGVYGEADLVSRVIPFDQTDYYDREMGRPLFRRVISFQGLIQFEELPGVKLITNEYEQATAAEAGRRVNIDPGVISRERLVLATGKNFTHRIPLTKGIYADLTLLFTQGRYQPLPWTYPDYASEELLIAFHRIRRIYIYQLKEVQSRTTAGKDGS